MRTLESQLAEMYQSLSRQTDAALRRGGHHDPTWDTEDVVQEGILRFLQLLHAAGASAVDPTKGTARQLLGGFVRVTAMEVTRKGRRRKTCVLPDEIADVEITNPLEMLAMDGDRRLSRKRRHFLFMWWKHLGERRKRALLRIHGPMFGRSDSTKPTTADHTAAFHARQRLKILLALLEVAEQANAKWPPSAYRS